MEKLLFWQMIMMKYQIDAKRILKKRQNKLEDFPWEKE